MRASRRSMAPQGQVGSPRRAANCSPISWQGHAAASAWAPALRSRRLRICPAWCARPRPRRFCARQASASPTSIRAFPRNPAQAQAQCAFAITAIAAAAFGIQPGAGGDPRLCYIVDDLSLPGLDLASSVRRRGEHRLRPTAVSRARRGSPAAGLFDRGRAEPGGTGRAATRRRARRDRLSARQARHQARDRARRSRDAAGDRGLGSACHLRDRRGSSGLAKDQTSRAQHRLAAGARRTPCHIRCRGCACSGPIARGSGTFFARSARACVPASPARDRQYRGFLADPVVCDRICGFVRCFEPWPRWAWPAAASRRLVQSFSHRGFAREFAAGMPGM